ncbi:MAG TPA: ABC transporter ATP-binding protein, partial [Actinomycetota bacterium]|nr:ABC transporter ATP-binding protein [Actinomycetota bacterium]
MTTAVSLRGVGVRFVLPRHSRLGKAPRLLGTSKQRIWGLRDVTLDVERGEAVGFIGPNGAGKTTLLRTIAGIYRPDEGSVIVRGRVGPLLSLSAGLMPQLSGWENIALIATLLGVPRKRVPEIAPRIGEFSGLEEFLDAEVRTYSSGMRARLGFAVAAFSDPELLVVDEILTVGDEEFRQKSQEVIERFVREGRTVLVATHQVQTLIRMCTRAVYLDGGRVVETGDPAGVVKRYREQHHVD